MDESRKQFERWINSLPMCSAERHRIDNDRYRFNTTEVAWKAWQASRAAIALDMPEPFKLAKSSSGLTYYYQDEVDAVLSVAGIKVKE